MCHVETTQKEIIETAQWHPRKKIDCLNCPSTFEGLFFILK